MAVYGYARVSTDKQAEDGESLGVQERQVQGWCLMQGEDLAEMFVDRGVSGSTPLTERPEGSALLKALRPGDIVVAAKLDRLFRSALDALQTVERLKGKKVKLWLLDLGEVTGNGMAKAFLTMASAFAELERDQIRERVTNTKRDQRQRGHYLGGRVPFGFEVKERTVAGRAEKEKVLTLVPVEQEIIEVVRQMRRGGVSFRSIQAQVEQQHRRRIALATLSRICSGVDDDLMLDGQPE
jgi:DNA invertase Pin-like site-specific DNA recombinase